VHDELVVEAQEAIAEEIKILTTKIMVEEMGTIFPCLPIAAVAVLIYFLPG